MFRMIRAMPLSFTVAAVLILQVSGAVYALAQDAAPPAPPAEAAAPAASPAPLTKFYLEVDQADLQLISQALVELPKRLADPLIMKLNAQLQAPAQAKIGENKDAAEKPKPSKKGK